MAKTGKKIIRYKKPKNLNIGMAVFAVIFLYLIIVLVQYMIKPKVKMYEVQDGDIANTSYYTGVILREEMVINSDYSGYVNYYLREKQKAAVGNLVFTVDENGSMKEYLNQSSGDKSRLSDENLKELKELLANFSSSYSDSRFSEVYDASAALSSRLMECINVNNLQELSSFTELENSISFQKCYAKISGVVIYSIDGLEGLTAEQVSADIFSQDNYQKTSLTGGELISSGSAAYKVITDDSWSVVIPLSEEELSDYTDVKSVAVHFPGKDLDATAGFSIVRGRDGASYGKIDLTKYMIQFAGDRFVEIEVKNSQAHGLKIPKTALVSKEAFVIPMEYLTTGGDSLNEGFYKQAYGNDGTVTTEFVEADILRITDEDEKQAAEAAGEEITDNCYVSIDNFSEGDYLLLPDSNERYQIGQKEVLTGVYNVNRGYAVFKYIRILDDNSEYCIAKKNVSYSLRTYDQIALHGDRVSDDAILH
ncbi:HlyD family efflux transporter periplasmic adaptor subunit [Fusibacillus kribbianus]|uniref:HlyD family efflux transporter periplasmic adaptor subunit n=1 Tax=Fusibacillus kribbianus TaxID=3044208 RepID=A0AAP4BB49_9FIRM|nr:HlyD family efflux transporter periplasmic adaptor subunit [Ruminococcus sp. YH-rum2234]MDI9242612.1 HlyD family efflux transporter periplasmic adaptor subunit [Ruminococcus sp. YH-rum2234]